MGRHTYEVFAPAWSSRSGDPMSDRMNTIRKVVVSTTLTDPEWKNTEVIAGEVVGRVRDLKGEDGGHIVQYGFGDVSRLLLEHGLFDQLRMWIYPQLVGPSDVSDLLYRPGTAATFDLVDTRVLSNGIVLATYAPLSDNHPSESLMRRLGLFVVRPAPTGVPGELDSYPQRFLTQCANRSVSSGGSDVGGAAGVTRRQSLAITRCRRPSWPGRLRRGTPPSRAPRWSSTAGD
jgi:dihydrofolate reductase